MITSSVTSPVWRAGVWLDKATSMFTHVRNQIIRPLILGWLLIMGASLVMWVLAWNRLSQGIEAPARAEPPGVPSAQVEATRHDLKAVYRMTWLAGILGFGTALFALYFYRVDYHREKAQRKLLEEKLHAED